MAEDVYEGGQVNRPRDVEGSADEEQLRGVSQSLLDLAQNEAGRKKVAQRLVKWWVAQNESMYRRHQEWRVNRARRKGINSVKLVKRDKDAVSYELYAPPSLEVMPPGMNKADRLCRRIQSFLFTDPPMPESVPPRDDDQARDAAELTSRVLQVVTSEGNLDDVRTARKAFDLACTYDSGFRHHYVDPTGGGQRAIEVQVHPQAEQLAQALPQPVNPQTGLPFTGPYVGKYVRLDGGLTNDRNDPELRMQQVPGLKTETLTGKNVRFLPDTADDLWDADGVLIGYFKPFGHLKQLIPDLQTKSEDELKALFESPPEGVERILTPAERKKFQRQELNDDAMIFCLTHYRRQGGAEPKGVYAIVLGSDYLAHISPWMNPRTKEALDIPLDQFKQFEDDESPYGRGLMRQLGGGNELLGLGYDAVLTHMERLKNRRIFLPTNSIIQAKQLQSATGTTIPVNPGGKPEYEDVPSMPSQYMQFIDLVTNDMNDESGLQEVAQGVNTPSVESGLHARQIIEQSIVALSDLRQNTTRGLIRGYRIYTQLMKAFFTVPQMTRFVGEEGGFKLIRWTGADFLDTSDVRITKGSFTQLSPPAKAAEAERMFAMVDEQGNRLVTLEELRGLVLGNVGGLLGLQDDPFRARVRRQIEVWERGMTPEFAQAMMQRQQLLQRAQAQLAGQPPEQQQQAMAALQQQLPPLPTPFDPSPVDDEPAVARTRHYELARYAVRLHTTKHPPPWVNVLLQAYDRARRAAGIMTHAEQQQAQQQQQQAEQQAQQQAAQQADRAQVREQDARLAEREMDATATVLSAQAQSSPEVKVSLTGKDFLDAARGS